MATMGGSRHVFSDTSPFFLPYLTSTLVANPLLDVLEDSYYSLLLLDRHYDTLIISPLRYTRLAAL